MNMFFNISYEIKYQRRYIINVMKNRGSVARLILNLQERLR